MNLGQSIWDRLTRLVLGLVVLAVILGLALWYQPVINANRGMRARKLELDQKIAAETQKAKKLEAALHAMQDPRTVERLARERLSYAKPGEDVILFESPLPTNPPPPAALLQP
ncbi:MAG: septum formation initiator family protein [Verrucomicrobiota bacterium]|jgi:cell division protein FtsB